MSRLRIATRGSALALAQSGMVAAALRAAWPELDVELIVIRAGARASAQDKSRFVKDIEDVLLAGDADLAVHSAKDLPGDIPHGLAIVAVPERADPRDMLCGAASLDGLARRATVGTASLRRRAQLLAVRRDLQVPDLRGNVDTRLRRLREGAFDAIVLAAAGLSRLDVQVGVPLAADLMVPAPGQGCLALEARVGDERVHTLARALDDEPSRRQLLAERTVARRLGADCQTALGAHARPTAEDALRLTAFVGLPDGTCAIRAALTGSARAPEALGTAVADILLAKGAGRVLSGQAAA
jgi:hydroxymethylbilane synthase